MTSYGKISTKHQHFVTLYTEAYPTYHHTTPFAYLSYQPISRLSFIFETRSAYFIAVRDKAEGLVISHPRAEYSFSEYFASPLTTLVRIVSFHNPDTSLRRSASFPTSHSFRLQESMPVGKQRMMVRTRNKAKGVRMESGNG